MTWGFEIDRRAKVNARSEVSRGRSSKTPEEVDYETAYKSQVAKISRKSTAIQWFPIYWLSFLLIGFPSGENGRTVLGAGISF